MHPSIFYGLFGGYMTYDDLICMRMLPLDRMVRYSGSYSGRVLAPRRLAVVAASLRIIDRAIVVDLSDGSVHVAAARSGANAPAAPADATPGARDGVLRCVSVSDVKTAECYFFRVAKSTTVCFADLAVKLASTQYAEQTWA